MNLIVCVDKNWGIGKDGKLLCHLKEDMKFFRDHTIGKVVVMGRSTLESLPKGEPLPDRTNIVLTHRSDFEKEGVKVVHDMEELLEELNNYDPDDVMIIGGASVYNEMMDMCDKLYVTRIMSFLRTPSSGTSTRTPGSRLYGPRKKWKIRA